MEYSAFHKLSYGIYLIATNYDGKRFGYIGNTAFQVTSHPEKIAISSHKNNFTTDKIIKSGKFALSVLSKDADTSLIGTFGFMSGSDIDKFGSIDTFTAKTGAPIIKDATVAWIDCNVVQSVDMGSHLLFIGEVVDSGLLSDDESLTYSWYREKYKMLAPKNAPTYIEKSKLDVESGLKTGKQSTQELPEKRTEENKCKHPHICSICGFQYNPEEGDPASGIPPGTPFEELPDDYRCPICNAGKEYFK
ncbi:MAG: High molecular weight rubredoxin [Draconibacterium sp.]|nr:MAG: High molecular weight rubredoxin [Draconibacterium sp.]